MKTKTRLELFGEMVAREVTAMGGSEEDQEAAGRWVQNYNEESVPPAIHKGAVELAAAVCGPKLVQGELKLIEFPRPRPPVLLRPWPTLPPTPRPDENRVIYIRPLRVIELRVMELRDQGMKWRDIKRELGYTRGRAEALYYRGKRKLRQAAELPLRTSWNATTSVKVKVIGGC
jgi:hypothetical protein